MATLGLACIVKNEEEVLARLLESVKNIVDQIIIVDTGSTDKTIEIAKSYNAEVYQFTWIDDFSAARNESFKHIKTDYILWLDADDIVFPEDAKKIKDLMEDPQYDQYLLTYHYAHDEYNKPLISFLRERIIKTSLNLKWEDPIHEYLPISGKIKECADISIHHYKTKSNAANTANRNIALLESALKRKPNARLQFYYAKELYDNREYQKAELEFLKFLDYKDSWDINRSEAHKRLAEYYFTINDFQKIELHLSAALKIEPKKAELFCLYGLLYINQKKWEEAIQWYEKALYNSEINNWGFNQIEARTWLPHLQLCLCYYHLGNLTKAEYHNNKALEYKPNDKTLLYNQTFLNTEKTKLKKEKIIFVVPYGKSGGIKRICETSEQLNNKGIDVEVIFWLWGEYITNIPQNAPFNFNIKYSFASAYSQLNLTQAKWLIACEWWLIPEIYKAPKDIIKIYYCLGDVYKYWPNQRKEIDSALALPVFKLTSSRNLQYLLKNNVVTNYVDRIPSAINLNIFQPKHQKIEGSIGLIYNNSQTKGCDIALKAFKRLKEENSSLNFHIFGFDDTLPDEYKNLFTYHKNLTPSEVADYMAKTKFWVIPSFSEGYSTIMLEAMATKNIVICSNITDFELIVHKFSGLKFNVGDEKDLYEKIKGILNDKDYQNYLISNAYDLVTKLAKWDVFIDNFLKYLDKVKKINDFKNKNLSIGFLCPVNYDFGPIRIRAHNIDRGLRSLGINSKFLIPLDISNLQNCDIYIASHCYNLTLLKKIKELNKFLILDICEDLFDLEETFKKAVEFVDLVICCSNVLAQKAKHYNKNVLIIEDAIEVPDNLDFNKFKEEEPLNLGWLGYKDNLQWLDSILPIIKNNNFNLITIHEGENQNNIYKHYKWDSNYYKKLKSEADVLIIKGNNDVQPAKSSNKLTGFLTLGLPIICDNRDSFKLVYNKNSNFFLINNDSEWDFALNKIKDIKLRKKLAIYGKFFNTGFFIEDIIYNWINILDNIKIEKKKIQLNAGCGKFKFDGFINLDINPNYNPDIVGDITNLYQFESNSIDFIFTSHTLEHLHEVDIKKALAEFYRILKPGGQIDIILPDTERVAKDYLNNRCDLKTFERWALAHGEHKVIFTEKRILSLLEEFNFTSISPFNLHGYPWVLVPDIRNPIPEPYHCSARAFKPKKTLDKVDIIIPTLGKNKDYLDLCIKSIKQNTNYPYEITLIQSNNIEKLNLEVDNYLINKKDLSFSEAINIAISKTKNKFIVLLNDDTIVTKNWLAELIKTHNSKTRIISAFSNCDFNWQHNHSIQTKNLNLVPNMELNQIKNYEDEILNYQNTKIGSKEVDWVAFFGVLFDRELINEIGYLNEEFQSGGEDVDFCNRVKAKGYKIGYCFNSFIFHFGGISRSYNLEERDQHNLTILNRKYKNKEIIFYSGPAWEKWTSKNINEQGIGGSETMLAKIAEEFVKIGLKVKVFNDCQDDAGIYNGVEYIHHTEFERYSTNPFDIFISSRIPWIFGLDIKSKFNICWVHDIWLSSDPKHYNGSDKVHKYFVLSPWHQQFFCNHHKISLNQTYMMPNGLDLSRFIDLPKKEKNRLIYSSSPDRGLDVLLSIFPKIRKEIQDSSLHIYYGFDNWEKSIKQSNNKQQLGYMNSIKEMMKQEGIFYHGRVNQNILAEEFGKSSLWAFPTNFSETFCLTATEAMAAGTPIICSHYAGLQETAKGVANFVFENKYKEFDNYSKEYQEEFINKVINILTDEKSWKEYQQKGLKKAEQYSFYNIAQKWIQFLEQNKVFN